MKTYASRCMWFLITLEILGGYSSVSAQKRISWAGFYDDSDLAVVENYTISDIKAHFKQNIWPALTKSEQNMLKNVEFSFPKEESDHPMNFHRNGNQIVLPQASLRFLRDVCLAFAYANRNKHSGQVVADYLAILKYQWPSGRLQKRHYRFGDALGIPKNAMDNAEVNKQFGSLYTTAVYFILCHELGHALYNHQGYKQTSDPQAKTREDMKSQNQEKQADAFSLNVLQRIGAPPFDGILTFFFAMSMIEPYPDEINLNMKNTHPLTSDRILAIAMNAENSHQQYAQMHPDYPQITQLFLDTGKKLRTIATILSKGDMQDIIRSRAQNGDLDNIGFPNKSRSYAKVSPSVGKGPFVGEFSGNTVDKKENTPLKISLSNYNGVISGRGSLIESNGPLLQIKDGQIKKDTLFFSWDMGDHYYGEGKLVRTKSGKLTGRWWTKKKGQEVTVGLIELYAVK